MSSFLLAFLAVLFFFSLDKGYAFQTRREAIQSNDPQYSHLVHLSSLLPSATCSSSSKGQLNLPYIYISISLEYFYVHVTFTYLHTMFACIFVVYKHIKHCLYLLFSFVGWEPLERGLVGKKKRGRNGQIEIKHLT